MHRHTWVDSQLLHRLVHWQNASWKGPKRALDLVRHYGKKLSVSLHHLLDLHSGGSFERVVSSCCIHVWCVDQLMSLL